MRLLKERYKLKKKGKKRKKQILGLHGEEIMNPRTSINWFAKYNVGDLLTESRLDWPVEFEFNFIKDGFLFHAGTANDILSKSDSAVMSMKSPSR